MKRIILVLIGGCILISLAIEAEGRSKKDGELSTEKSRPELSEKRREDRPFTIVALDNCLSAGREANSYHRILEERLRKRYQNEKIKVVHLSIDEKVRGYPPLARVARLNEAISLQPDLVLISRCMKDIVNCVPIEELERHIHVITDQIEARTKAKVILLVPPPDLINPRISIPYAIKIKQIGLRNHLPVVDLYSAFLCSGDEWRSLFQDDIEPDAVHYLYPNGRGQRMIAEEVFKVITGLPYLRKVIGGGEQ